MQKRPQSAVVGGFSMDIEDFFQSAAPPCLQAVREQLHQGIHWNNFQRTFVIGSLVALDYPATQVKDWLVNTTGYVKNAEDTKKYKASVDVAISMKGKVGGYTYGCRTVHKNGGCPMGGPELCCEKYGIDPVVFRVKDNAIARQNK
jgi:hypothetical protein